MHLSRSGGRLGLFVRTSATLVVAIAAPTMGQSSEHGLVLVGYNASYFGDVPMESEGGVSSQALCGPDGVSALQKASQAVLERLSERIPDPGLPTLGEMEAHARAIRTELCQGDGGFDLQPNVVTYSACRMTMDQQSVMTDMRLPGAAGEGAMEIADFWKAELTRIPLYPADASAKAANAGQRASAINWAGPGGTRQIAGYPATRWDFQYSSDMGMGGMAGMKVSMTTQGHGYFSKDVPGAELLEAFYQGFAKGISFEQGGGPFFEGLMNSWVEVLQRGLPLEMDQTVKSSMSGMGMDSSSRSVLKIAGLKQVSLPDDFCTRALVPDYFEVTDAGAALSGMGSAPGAGAAQPGGQAESGMSALGSLMEMMNSAKDQGFAAPGAQQAPAANPAGQSAARSSGGALPSSAQLTTGNLTQSVQMHLQALGYDTGNTDGELSTETIIAISQFQAEKGMEATGEVTPQLLGILGAEVDSR